MVEQRRRGGERPGWRRWLVAYLAAGSIHAVLILAVIAMLRPALPEAREEERLAVSLISREESRPEPVFETARSRAPADAAPRPRTAGRDRPFPPIRLPRIEEAAPAPSEEEVETGEREGEGPGRVDLGSIDIEPSLEVLARIADGDLRLQRMLSQSDESPFSRARRPRKENLPPDVDIGGMRGLLDLYWAPAWEHLKDDPVRRTIRNWYAIWMKQLRERRALERLDPGGEAVPGEEPPALGPEPITDTIVILIDAEPLRDGTWAVSLVEPSGHPFLDRRALADAETAAEAFPPWEAGWGSALRFRFEAEFVVIPPSLSIGLMFKSIDDIELLYPFKRIIDKHVYFEGIVDGPGPAGPRPDAGADGGSARRGARAGSSPRFIAPGTSGRLPRLLG